MDVGGRECVNTRVHDTREENHVGDEDALKTYCYVFRDWNPMHAARDERKGKKKRKRKKKEENQRFGPGFDELHGVTRGSSMASRCGGGRALVLLFMVIRTRFKPTENQFAGNIRVWALKRKSTNAVDV
jgi:hypothetical protein